MSEVSNEAKQRLEKIEAIRNNGENPFTYRFERSHHIHDVVSAYPDADSVPEDAPAVTLAGRLMSKREHGKAMFGNIRDNSGDVQFYVNNKLLGDENFEKALDLDVGDIVGVTGTPFYTRRGEFSIRLTTIKLLTKAVNPLPEKYHGLQDVETRYRQRYVDLIANPDVKDAFKLRSRVIKGVRDYLHNDDFMEVETPVLQSIYGGAAARPFMTHHNELSQDLFLRISLELPLKRLIVGGYEKVFEIGRVFRNEGVSYKHNPEYTLMELYQAYADYTDMMALTESLISSLVKEIHGSYKMTYQDTEIDFTPPFRRLKLNDALQEYAGISFDDDETTLAAKAKELGLDVGDDPHKGHLINLIYDKAVEPKLIQPVFIMDYPWETSPLAKKHRDNPKLVERFELIIHSMELANAFSELNDPVDQHARFMDQITAREAGDDEAHQMDEDYVNALKYGMPPTGGLGIGIDRIVMLLTNSSSIRDVLFFPHMKTIQS